jgi:hypothetical protein
MMVQVLSNLGQILALAHLLSATAAATSTPLTLAGEVMYALLFTLCTSVLHGMTLLFWESRSAILFRLNAGMTLCNAVIVALVFHLF